MSAELIPHPVTVEEFLATLSDGQKADLIDGVIYMASPDSPRNDKVAYLIRYLLQEYARSEKLGEAYGSRVAFTVGRHRCPEPDVSFVSSERVHIIGPKRGLEAPDIAVEIVSEDSVQRDYVQKRVLYEDAGVREYWIVDPYQRRCTFLRLDENREYVAVPLQRARFFRSEVLHGLWLDVEWLLADPLPDEGHCLQQILAGPPPSA